MNIMDAAPKTTLLIPPFYYTKLNEKPELVGPLYTTIHNFEAWVSDCHFEFFPEYTKHGIDHLQYVLASVFGLIHDNTKENISSEDVCALSLAVLLHDAGMYFSADNVRGLLLSTYRDNYAGLSKNETWKQRWEGYIEEAKHWDSARRQQVLGEMEETFSLRSFNLENKDLRDSDKRFIGEFLRRNHPDLAYTIAMYGLPHENKEEQQLIDEKITEKMRKIGGMIALSHGYDLRKAIELVEESFPGKNVEKSHAKVHITFLMVSLRIADYLHIHADRAKSEFAWNFCNSNSKLEQKLHTAISAVEVEVEGCDPECINVDCEPKELDVILGLQDRFTGLQRELDQCWAVLGGVYKSNGYKLRYRRISTSIDDLEEYTTKEELSFIPKRFHLGVAQAEIIKLLIRPLYGDQPEYGIRELLQNAVDAVLEREAYEEKHGDLPHCTEYEIEGEVEIALIKHAPNGTNQPRMTVQVTDKGIGMTEEVIQHYFLTAGASFRNSLAWKKEFEEVNAHGAKSRVCRSGRFGIGAFAAFLLGDKITVTTRHITSEVGYHFIVGQNDELIQVDKVWEAPVGTKIEVEIGERVYDELHSYPDNWDWFCLEHPKVIRYIEDRTIENGERALESRYLFDKSTSKSIWRNVEFEKSIQLEYICVHDDRVEIAEAVNGFRLTGDNHAYLPNYRSWGDAERIVDSIPQRSWLDPNGKLSMSLNRDRLYYNIKRSDMIKDIYKTLIAYMLSLPNRQNPYPIESIIDNSEKTEQRAFKYKECSTSKGCIPKLFNSMGYWGLEYVILYFYPHAKVPPIFEIDENECVCYIANHFRDIYLEGAMNLSDEEQISLSYPDPFATEEIGLFTIPFDIHVSNIGGTTYGAKPKYHEMSILESILRTRNGKISSWGKPGRDLPEKFIMGNEDAVIIEFTLGEYNESKPSLFIQTWEKYIGKRAIPYDEEERKLLFPKAYEELGPVIEQFKKKFIEEENEINRW